MKILKLVCVFALILLLTGCACKTRRVGSNIPLAEAGGLLKDVHFAFDSYALSAEAKETINANYQHLKDNSDWKVTLEGHCDERGTNEYNMVLGSNRAQAVSDYLTSLGLPAGQSSTVSYGEELPLDPGHNEAAWAKNRRVHFSLGE